MENPSAAVLLLVLRLLFVVAAEFQSCGGGVVLSTPSRAAKVVSWACGGRSEGEVEREREREERKHDTVVVCRRKWRRTAVVVSWRSGGVLCGVQVQAQTKKRSSQRQGTWCRNVVLRPRRLGPSPSPSLLVSCWVSLGRSARGGCGHTETDTRDTPRTAPRSAGPFSPWRGGSWWTQLWRWTGGMSR